MAVRSWGSEACLGEGVAKTSWTAFLQPSTGGEYI